MKKIEERYPLLDDPRAYPGYNPLRALATIGFWKCPELANVCTDDGVEMFSSTLGYLFGMSFPLTAPTATTPHEAGIQMLCDIEMVALARLGADLINDVRFSYLTDLRKELGTQVARMEAMIREAPGLWRYGRIAEEVLASSGTGLAPWSWIRSGAEGEFGGVPRSATIEDWRFGYLGADDERQLSLLISTTGPWQDSYRVALNSGR